MEALALPGTERTRYAAFDLTTYVNLEVLGLVASDARRPETVAEEPEGMDNPTTIPAPQEAAERRSWWRRLLDG